MLLSNKISFICIILLFITFWGCRPTQEVTVPESQTERPVDRVSSLQVMFDSSRVFSGNFTGFMLYDPETDSILFAQNEDKYFTPASNTKLFTFYAGLKMLPDSIPAMQYAIQGDSLIFRGTGAPSFLHPDFGNLEIYDFLKNSDKQLYYSDSHFDDEVLGPGWSWSDFNYYYSAEKSPFPIYGNIMRVTVEEIEKQQIASGPEGLKVSPAFFRSRVNSPAYDMEKPLIAREFFDNDYKYFPKSDTMTYTVDRPFHYTPELITEMLSDTLGQPVGYLKTGFPDEYETLYSISSDTVYKRMLQPSDNFIAEQLLLVVSSQLGESLNSRNAIDYMKENYLNEMPEDPQWVDGSGLSRYNMFSPRSMIWLIKQIDDEYADDRKLFELLPAGGESGTIRNWYAAPEGENPYVYAKTGTLSNNHCLSGFILTQSGRKLIFSFMNNHYVSSSSVVKEEMERMLEHIRDTY